METHLILLSLYWKYYFSFNYLWSISIGLKVKLEISGQKKKNVRQLWAGLVKKDFWLFFFNEMIFCQKIAISEDKDHTWSAWCLKHPVLLLETHAEVLDLNRGEQGLNACRISIMNTWSISEAWGATKLVQCCIVLWRWSFIHCKINVCTGQSCLTHHGLSCSFSVSLLHGCTCMCVWAPVLHLFHIIYVPLVECTNDKASKSHSSLLNNSIEGTTFSFYCCS